MRFRSLLFISIISFSLLVTADNTPRSPKNVQTALRAKWSGTPLLLEASELLSKQQQHYFWNFIDIWINSEPNDDVNANAKYCVKKILEHGRSLLTEPLASVFEFSLILRSASPTLVLYRQLARDSLSSFPLLHNDNEIVEIKQNETQLDPLRVRVSVESPGGKCCWIDTGEHLFFHVNELRSWLQNNHDHRKVGDSFQSPTVFEFDHVHFDSATGSPVAILYGALGTNCFKEFHVALLEAAKQGKVKYVLRPVLPAGCEAQIGPCGSVGVSESVNLGGYGVELALKNMEYKAMDDSAVKKGVTLEDPRIEDLSQEVRGFIFSKILDRKPELASEIMAFRDYLLSSTVSDTLDV